MKEAKQEEPVQDVQAPAEMVALPLEVVNQVLNYLGTRPYQESAKLIVAVQSNAQKV